MASAGTEPARAQHGGLKDAADPHFGGDGRSARALEPAQPRAGLTGVQAGGSAHGGTARPAPVPVAIAAPQPESLITDGVRSLEVRWIFPGQLEAVVAGWFGQFPAAVESREDTYLLDPRLRRLSVKIRGARQ